VKFEFKDFESFLKWLKKAEEKQQLKAMLYDPRRLLEFKQAYDGLCKIASETSPDIKVNVSVNKYHDGIGSFTIETDEFVSRNVEEFVNSLKNSSTFEVYPLLNGNIRIGVTFHDVMVEVNN